LRAERDALGAVNLRAADELAEAERRHAALAAERDDLADAVRLLRRAVGVLNREGGERLQTAFEAVNAHFKRLFTTLFEGGSAELTLIESQDPLEAGLDITVVPPAGAPSVSASCQGASRRWPPSRSSSPCS
jgi:chromosome segregation protein